MFKFDFDINEGDDDDVPSTQSATAPHAKQSAEPCQPETSASGAARYRTITLDELIELLPPAISFSPLALRFPGRSQTVVGAEEAVVDEVTILRRDLYDARFQILEDGDADSSSDADPNDDAKQDEEAGTRDGVATQEPIDDRKYVDADTDLIPGTYEGGLKTWEGGIDLVDVLHGFERELASQHERGTGSNEDAVVEGGQRSALGRWIGGKRILEIGCGTALPSLFLLQKIIGARESTSSSESDPSTTEQADTRAGALKTTFHLQDYNLSVLHLVTLPNIILSVLPRSYIRSHATTANDLDLSDELLQEFRRILDNSGVKLMFSCGDWEGFGVEVRRKGGREGNRRVESDEGSYDLIMTAETIYRQESVDSLISVLKNSVNRTAVGDEPASASRGAVAAEEGLQSLSIRSNPIWELPLTLVAAKILYFGVGGGIRDFLDRVQTEGGSSEDVKVWKAGVGRKVVRLDW